MKNNDKKITNVPNLRFSEFDDEWKPFKLLDAVERITRKNKNNECSLPLTISAQYGLIDQKQFFGKNIASKNLTNYYLLYKGDFAYNKSYSKDYSWGAVKRLNFYDKGVVSNLYICFKPTKIDSNFLECYFETNKWNKQVSDIAGEGARNHGLLNMSTADFFNTRHFFPSAKEQIKIASLISLINQKIDTQNKIIKDLFSYKNALIDYMIKNLENEKLTISEFIKKSYARIIKPSELTPFCGQKKYISTSCVDENGIISVDRLITYNDRPSRASMKPIINSIWFAKMKNSIKVYKSVNDDENQYVLSTGFYGILCDNNKVEKNWVLEVFRSKYFNNQKDRFSEGSSMSGIKDNQLNDIKVPLFKNKKNEKNAAILLTKISKKILCEKELLNRYLRQKTYLLQNLFI